VHLAERGGSEKGERALNFRELNDAQLAELSDEELIAYIVRARAAGREGAAVRAAQILAFSYEQEILGWFYNNMGSKGQVVVEELAAVTIRDAIKWAESFQGTSAKEFRAAVYVIARRRQADYLRKKRVDERSWVFEGSEEAEEREFGWGDPLDSIDEMSIFNQALGELKKDSHKLVVFLNLYGYSHREIAEKVTSQLADSGNDPMTENNVSKIISRFNKRLDKLLDEADDPPPPPDDDD